MYIQRIGTTVDKLGEAIFWDSLSRRLYWADANIGVIRKLDVATGVLENFQAPAPLGALFITQSDRILLTLQHAAQYFDPKNGALETYASLTDADQTVRLNDGKVDRRGRLVVGSLYLGYKTDQNYRAKFYTLGSDRTFHSFEENVGITNGPCFSPEGDVLYVADTARRIIWAYDYDSETGVTSRKRLFADDALLQGMPDGGTVDADGCVWFTIMTRSVLVRISPAGKLVDTIELPVNPTSLAFGGDNLDVLYVTSLSQSVNIDVTASEAGGLFAITGLGVAGVPEVRFAD